MIPLTKKIIDLTWGEVVSDLDERYGKNIYLSCAQLGMAAKEFMSIKDCAALTGYKPDYIRQLVFKRKIPFHKNPNRKPIRFNRDEILQWMATKKFTPIDELAETYVNGGKRKVG